ncbi:transposase [Burkholderia multivorans]|uniref:transposase n=1 Tax=Burkholderia multivorans TaxID=87883 RepID=UPI0007549440|nr:transposase [Burkholderia multivorans]KVR42403.1 integrase [Burkholderia multivorans]
MMSDLLNGDRLAPPGKPESYLEVMDRHLHGGCIQIFDAEKRTARFEDDSTIRKAISTGALVLHRKGMPPVSVAAQANDLVLAEHRRVLTWALRRIDKICEQRGMSFSAAIPLAREAYERERVAERMTRKFPSRTALFDARKRQESGLPVLSGDKNKGNATRRYSEKLRKFALDVIKEYFLVTESKWTILKVTDYVNREARRRELHVAPHPISRKFVASLVLEATADAEYDRMDPLDRVAGKSHATRRIRAPFPFARIEQDALHLPFVVKTEDGGVSRDVWLVLAVDANSGYPVGWHLVIGQPREMDSLRCLEMYLTPAKGARFKALGIAHTLNIYGTAVQIIFDNGSEVKGARIVRLEVLEIDVKHCKAKEAQGKPFIERLNKSLKEAVELLDGCTRFNGKDGARDPVALGDKLKTQEELERWIVRWLYEDWVNTPLDRLRWDELLVDSVKGKTPLERMRWATEEAGYPIPMPPPRQEWMAALYEHDTCALSANTGVSVEGFRYKGPAITYLVSKYGDHAPLYVLYNPDDFREVYVYEGHELPLVTLTHEHVRPDTPAWTFKEAKELFKASKDGGPIPPEKEQFLRDLDADVTQNKPARRTRGKRAESQETTRRSKVQAAVQRAVDNPLSSGAAFGPPPSTNPFLPEEEFASDAVSYDDAPVMNMVNKHTGEKLR